jgi:hypothetical protein
MTTIIIAVIVLLLVLVLIGAYYAMNTGTPGPVQTSPKTAAAPATKTFTLEGCEGQPPVLECPAGKSIKKGSIKYGRWNNNVCPHPTVGPRTVPKSQTFDLPADALGKQKYQYGAINVVHGADPYPGVYKQFAVEYTCV